MIIRNKFNGYGFDGARLYNDPATLALMAQATTAATTAATVAAPTIAATTALPTVVAAGSTLPTTAAFTGQTVTPALTSAGGAGSGGIFANPAAYAASTGAAPGAGTGIMEASSLNAIDPSVAQLAEAQNIASQNLAAQGSNIQGAAGQSAVAPQFQGGSGTTYSTYPSQQFNPTTGGVDTVSRTSFTHPSATTPNVVSAPTTTPVDPTYGGLSGNYVGAEESSKGLIVPKGFDPNILGQGGGGAPGGINVTPEMASKFGTEKVVSWFDKLGEGFMKAMEFAEKHPLATTAVAQGVQYMMRPKPPKKKKYEGSDMSSFQASAPSTGIYNPVYETSSNYAAGGQVEQMAAMNALGANTGYPMASLQTPMYSNPAIQRPQATNVVAPSADAGVNTYTGEPRFAEGGTASSKYLKQLEAEEKRRQERAEKAIYQAKKFDVGIDLRRSRTQMLNSPYAAALQELQSAYKKRGIPFAKPAKTSVDVMGDSLDEVPYAAGGGIMSHLGGYSDGGRLLKGPGDGMSDSIPAKIGAKQPARLADGEFVVPADVVSHLGNGSTEAGAKKLYAMMDKVRHARTGNKKQGKQINPDKFIPKA